MVGGLGGVLGWVFLGGLLSADSVEKLGSTWVTTCSAVAAWAVIAASS